MTKTLNIIGNGKVCSMPNIAYINIGVETKDSVDVRNAQRENTEKMNAIITAIKEMGLKETDIETREYDIEPVYETKKWERTGNILAYTVKNMIKVTVRDLNNVGKIVDACVQNGANASCNIRFALENYDEYYNQALRSAVQNAKEKAELIASVYGTKIDVPVEISEEGYEEKVYGKNTEFINCVTLSEETGSYTSIQTEEIEVNARIYVKYEY